MGKTVVLIPCYNEAPTIEKVVHDARKALPKAEIYVYDNNSTDGTGDLASSAGARVVKETRQGKGNVVESMLRDIDADCYIIVDGDDTYGLESAPEMERLVLEEHVDMVVGDRLSGAYYHENKRPFHGLGNAVVTFLVRLFFGKGIHDVMTGYRAFSKRFAKEFHPRTKGFEIETELSILALYSDYKIATLTIDYRDRPEGCFSKLNTVSDGIKILRLILRSFLSLKPFEAACIVSIPFLLSSLILLACFAGLGGPLSLLIAAIATAGVALVLIVVGGIFRHLQNRKGEE